MNFGHFLEEETPESWQNSVSVQLRVVRQKRGRTITKILSLLANF